MQTIDLATGDGLEGLGTDFDPDRFLRDMASYDGIAVGCDYAVLYGASALTRPLVTIGVHEQRRGAPCAMSDSSGRSAQETRPSAPMNSEDGRLTFRF
jgi:hypothetical protein